MPTEDDIRKLLRQVVDPEVGANIVDLGLIYRIDLSLELPYRSDDDLAGLSDERNDPGRGAGDPRGKPTKNCRVELCLVWEPPWRPDMMSERTRSNLGW